MKSQRVDDVRSSFSSVIATATTSLRSVSLLMVLLDSLLTSTNAQSSSFDPYELNGGLVTAVAGKDFSIIATDTRMFGGGGYLLQSRSHLSNRLWSVEDDASMSDIEEHLRACPDNSSNNNDNKRSEQQQEGAEQKQPLDTFVVWGKKQQQERLPGSSHRRRHRAPVMIGSSGCSTDCCQLQRTIRADYRAASYFGQVCKSNPDQVATMLSQTLYSRRFFPFYAFCVVSGLDDGVGGGGKVYVYDAIGSYEQVAVAAAGTGRELVQPVLDRLFAQADVRPGLGSKHVVEGTADEAVEALCRAYRSVSEREIGVGDKLVVHVSEVEADGDVSCRVLVIPLKQH